MNRAFLTAVMIGQFAIGHAFAGESQSGTESLPRVAVHYGDLNVESAAGRRALTSRLTRAARSVCPDAQARDLRTKSAGLRCVRNSVADALSIVGEQRLARASREASKRS